MLILHVVSLGRSLALNVRVCVPNQTLWFITLHFYSRTAPTCAVVCRQCEALTHLYRVIKSLRSIPRHDLKMFTCAGPAPRFLQLTWELRSYWLIAIADEELRSYWLIFIVYGELRSYWMISMAGRVVTSGCLGDSIRWTSVGAKPQLLNLSITTMLNKPRNIFVKLKTGDWGVIKMLSPRKYNAVKIRYLFKTSKAFEN